MKRVCLVAALWLTVGMCVSAFAQRTTGELIGKVADESGSVLPGVAVRFEMTGAVVSTTLTTNCMVPWLPSGCPG